MKIDAAERETVIQWSDADQGIAHVYSCQGPMMRKLAKHPRAKLVETHRDDTEKVTAMEFELPLECVHIRRGRRRVTDTQREAARQNAAKARSKRASPVVSLV
ncbi:MAG TPA: hypothetical protein VKV57_14895 [bacterium]|nr:hypothetical protein [bacterium]